jgi:hypothetical protein
MNKELNLYGIEKQDETMAAYQRLKQLGYEIPNNMDFPIFRAGYMAALEDLKIKKSRAADRKAKKFLIADFIDTRLDYNREFLKGVYYDKDNKALVTTNGNFLVYTACDDIPAQYENKIVDKNGVIIDGRFPNWQRVVPEEREIEVVPNNNKFISDVINTNINFNLTMAAACKDSRVYKIGEFVFSAKRIKYMDLFLKTQKNVIVKMYKEDITGGDYCKPKTERAVVLEGDTATMVVMPYIASTFKEDEIIYIGEVAA